MGVVLHEYLGSTRVSGVSDPLMLEYPAVMSHLMWVLGKKLGSSLNSVTLS